MPKPWGNPTRTISLAKNASNLFDSRNPDGDGVFGGGGSTGDPVISSVNDNGDGTITITGSGFGTKDQASPVLYDFVDRAYENGQLNDFHGTFFSDNQTLHDSNTEANRIYDGISTPLGEPGAHPTIDRSPVRYRKNNAGARHSGVTDFYQIRHGAFIGLPIAYGGDHGNNPGDVRFDRPDGETQLYVAWWMWTNASPFNLYIIQVENLSGTFITGDSFRRGERITIFGAGNSGGDVEGWIHFLDTANKVMHFEYDTNSEKSSLNNFGSDGSNFTGADSGATGKLIDGSGNQSWTRSTSPNKYARFWETGGGSSGLRATWAVDRIFIGDINSVDGDLGWEGLTPDSAKSLDWNLFEIMFDKGNPDSNNFQQGRVQVRFNHQLINDDAVDPRAMEEAFSSPTMQLLGMNTGAFPGHDFRISEVYQDKTWQRVLLADSSDISTASHYEFQRPLSWSDTEIVVEKVQGSLSSTTEYISVADRRSVISSGAQI